jgi:NMD protein affecting ribosome stability and mRNA decay
MRRCALCQKSEEDLIGGLCGRCDHIQGDVMADLRAEFGPGAV